MPRILLVDDEPDTLEFLSYNLLKEGFDVDLASCGKEALEKAAERPPDLVLLDVMLPGLDGIETCRQMTGMTGLRNTVIAFLTARGEDYSHIAGLDAGADDYITKPIRPRLLVSKVKALLRRKNSSGQSLDSSGKEGLISARGITIDRERHLIKLNGTEISLPRKEFNLLFLFMANPGKVFTRDQLLDAVWGNEVVVGDRTVDVHVRHLREKIGCDRIITVKGVGYKFT